MTTVCPSFRQETQNNMNIPNKYLSQTKQKQVESWHMVLLTGLWPTFIKIYKECKNNARLRKT